MQSEETLNVGATAALLHAEADTVLQFARRGELPGTRIGKSWVFLREDVTTFLKGHIRQETEERCRRQTTAATPEAVLVSARPHNSRRTSLPALPDIASRRRS